MERPRHVIRYGGREFHNDYVFPAEIAALRAHKTGKFQEEVILQWLEKRALRGVYFDVGAHIGNHTLFFAAFCPSTKVIAIEGHPEIRELLIGNVKRNLPGPNGQKVKFFHAAAWDLSNHTVSFAPIPRNNAGHTHIVNTGGRGDEKPSVQQKTIALDDIPIGEDEKVAVLKIDVEDTEEQVIEGALDMIGTHRPVIIIERHSKQQLEATLFQLRPFGYRPTVEWAGVHTFALEAKR